MGGLQKVKWTGASSAPVVQMKMDGELLPTNDRVPVLKVKYINSWVKAPVSVK